MGLGPHHLRMAQVSAVSGHEGCRFLVNCSSDQCKRPDSFLLEVVVFVQNN